MIETRKSRAEASTSDSSAAYPQVDELKKLVKSLSVEMEKLKFEERRAIRTPRMMIIGVISEYPIIPLRSSKEIKEIGIVMTTKSKPLSKITWLLMKKERKKMLILKSIVLVTPLRLLI
jgi:hypothetical protein